MSARGRAVATTRSARSTRATTCPLDSLEAWGTWAPTGRYASRSRPDRLARSLDGRYRTDDDAFTGTETAYREGRAGFGFRWSPRTLARVVNDNGVDEDALLLEAANHDDGNKFFKRSELEAAAAALGDVEEWGLISDIDKTILPPHSIGVDALPDPYPGVSWLYWEIAWPGDTTYVTARDPSMLDGITDWMEEHELPDGPIETGPANAPWLSQAEKVRDVKRVLAANPGKRFVFFGDSSHRDPAVYRQILAEHPDQVKTMIIHKVTNTVSAHWVVGLHLVENYAEAAAVLFKEGVLDEDAARRTITAAPRRGAGAHRRRGGGAAGRLTGALPPATSRLLPLPKTGAFLAVWQGFKPAARRVRRAWLGTGGHSCPRQHRSGSHSSAPSSSSSQAARGAAASTPPRGRPRLRVSTNNPGQPSTTPSTAQPAFSMQSVTPTSAARQQLGFALYNQEFQDPVDPPAPRDRAARARRGAGCELRDQRRPGPDRDRAGALDRPHRADRPRVPAADPTTA